MQETLETQVRYLGQEGPPAEGMAAHSSVLAWRISWTEEPGGATVHGAQSWTRLRRLGTHPRWGVREWLGGAAGGLPCPPLRRCWVHAGVHSTRLPLRHLFLLRLFRSGSGVFWPLCILLSIICQDCVRRQSFLVLDSFFVLCCWRRCLSRPKHCSRMSQVPGPSHCH